eukprot:g3629.t1
MPRTRSEQEKIDGLEAAKRKITEGIRSEETVKKVEKVIEHITSCEVCLEGGKHYKCAEKDSLIADCYPHPKCGKTQQRILRARINTFQKYRRGLGDRYTQWKKKPIMKAFLREFAYLKKFKGVKAIVNQELDVENQPADTTKAQGRMRDRCGVLPGFVRFLQAGLRFPPITDGLGREYVTPTLTLIVVTPTLTLIVVTLTLSVVTLTLSVLTLTLSALTLTLSVLTLSVLTLIVVTLSVLTPSVMSVSVTTRFDNDQSSSSRAYAKC